MKKIIFILLAFITASCGSMQNGGGKYADFIRFSNRVMDMTEETSGSIEKASTTEDVARALKDHIARAEKFADESVRLKGKYPELLEMDEAPKELAGIVERGSRVGERLEKALRAKSGLIAGRQTVLDELMKMLELYQVIMNPAGGGHGDPEEGEARP